MNRAPRLDNCTTETVRPARSNPIGQSRTEQSSPDHPRALIIRYRSTMVDSLNTAGTKTTQRRPQSCSDSSEITADDEKQAHSKVSRTSIP